MNDILAALQNYYATHSKAEILEDWDSTKEFDEIGITVENYLILDHYTNYQFSYNSPTTKSERTTNYNPEYSSGFFITKNTFSYARLHA